MKRAKRTKPKSSSRHAVAKSGTAKPRNRTSTAAKSSKPAALKTGSSGTRSKLKRVASKAAAAAIVAGGMAAINTALEELAPEGSSENTEDRIKSGGGRSSRN